MKGPERASDAARASAITPRRGDDEGADHGPVPDANPAPGRIPGRSPRLGLAPGAAVGEPPGVGLFRRRITEDTDLEGISDKRLLQEHRRRVLAATDPHGGVAVGATFGLASDIEDVLDRRGVSYPSAEEILGARPGGS